MKSGKTDPVQSRRFIETARELECDEDEATFEEKLRRIAKAKPAARPAFKPKRERKSGGT